MRSRAVHLPLACCFSTALAEPAWTASSIRRSRSASLPSVVWMSMSSGTSVPSAWCCAHVLDSSPYVSPCVDSWANLVGMSDHEDSRPPIERQPPRPVAGGWRWSTRRPPPTPSVADRFRAGEGEGLVLVAEHQTAGRGRLGREWVAPARSSLTVSFLLVPDGRPAGALALAAAADRGRRRGRRTPGHGRRGRPEVAQRRARRTATSSAGSCSSGSSTAGRPRPSSASASTAPRPPTSSPCRRRPRWRS